MIGVIGMMKEEFEALIGFKVSEEVWKECEFVYMNDGYFHDKQQFADFFLLGDYNAIHSIYLELTGEVA